MKFSLPLNFGLLPAFLSLTFSLTATAQEAETKDPTPSAVEQFINKALKANDANGDGRVTEDEATGSLKNNFAKIDQDNDGAVSRAELAGLAKWRNRQQKNRKNAKRSAPPVVPEGVVFETDIAYREGNSKWKLDLAKPKIPSSTPQPAIVVIHGGGWQGGNKADPLFRSTALQYASRGYVCVSVNYRLTNEGTVLDCIADCKCAVRWLRANAAKYNVDPERIGAFGNSAGAHLVAVLGLTSKEAGLEGDGPFQEQSSLVQAVCCCATPTDFVDWGKEPSKHALAMLKQRFGAENFEESMRIASPVTHASNKACPFLIIHGTADKTVPVAQGDALNDTLKKVGAADATYLRFDGAGHGVFGQRAEKTRPAMEKFFDRVLKLESGEESE